MFHRPYKLGGDSALIMRQKIPARNVSTISPFWSLWTFAPPLLVHLPSESNYPSIWRPRRNSSFSLNLFSDGRAREFHCGETEPPDCDAVVVFGDFPSVVFLVPADWGGELSSDFELRPDGFRHFRA